MMDGLTVTAATKYPKVDGATEQKGEPMADLIDRKAALDICDEYNGHGYVWLCIRGKIEQLPSEARKTGRWMFPDPPIHKPICSECGKPCIGLHAFAYALTDYCPNCGARMEVNTEG